MIVTVTLLIMLFGNLWSAQQLIIFFSAFILLIVTFVVCGSTFKSLAGKSENKDAIEV